ncbi:ABC transporter permease subunit [Acidaminobacter sp. JC074]|uniref:ABC transporter permease n=1 Tax=Acidaminobacter sp. JC074 TaxID=2530199 RepID=UPI001F0E0A43|nr:ABC transporter permease subunit [Acidaminobacter sp. JC074]MCH4889948.1 ABC transporter permease subunit [Acidaminobacter sp. JC074]
MKKYLVWAVILIPIIMMTLLSVFSYYKFPQVLPSNFTLDYWHDVLIKNPLFYKGLFSSIVIGLSTSLMSTIIGFLTGRALVYHLGGFSKGLALLISMPLLIPGMILFMGMHQVILITPFKNTMLGIVLVHTVITLPYTTNIAIAYFTGIPKAYEMISSTLGAGYHQTFLRITLPLLKPGLSLSLVISFLISNTEYFSTFLIGGGKVISLSMVMFPYINNADYGHSAVMGIIFLGIHLFLFLIVDRLSRKSSQVLFGGN